MRELFQKLFGATSKRQQLRTATPEEMAERARSLRELGRYGEAIELLEQIVPVYPQALAILGNTLAMAGRTEEARNCFLRGVQVATNVGKGLTARVLASDCLANLGELSWAKGSKREGVAHLETVVAMWSEKCGSEAERLARSMALSGTYLSLALKYKSMGKLTDARRWASARLEFVPDCPQALEICSDV